MNEFLANIISGINSVVHSYGWSIIIFTVLVKLLVMPLDYKSRKSMRRMTAVQPQMEKLQKKYANDKEKLNQKMAELYRKEGVSPMSGCLPMLISMVILMVMWGAMRLVANTELVKQALGLLANGGEQVNEGFLWIKNIWMPDSPFAPVIADHNSLKMIPADVWSSLFQSLDAGQISALAAYGLDANTLSAETVFAALQTLPNYAQETALWSTLPQINLLIARLSIYANNNGWFVLPILAAVTQYLMTLSQPQTATTAANQQAGMGNFMKYFFPLFSLWICSSYNAMFSLYWVMSNLVAWVQSLVMNRIFEKKDQEEHETIEEGSLK